MTPIYGKPDFEKIVERGKGIIVVKFWRENCPPCQRVSQLLHDWEDLEEVPATYYSVNPKDRGNWNICRKYKVQFFPTVLTFKDGVLINTCEGSLPSKKMVLGLD
jgi:thiol-disulfide isomerase/thioredoxin